jgi:hypothetical protein
MGELTETKLKYDDEREEEASIQPNSLVYLLISLAELSAGCGLRSKHKQARCSPLAAAMMR